MSSPVVWNGKLYTWTRIGEVTAGAADDPTLAPGPKTQEALVCVDTNTGKVLWQHVNNMTQTEVPFHRLGWSSPCVDPGTGRVYAMGSQAWLLCLDGDTGKVIWQRQMTEEFGMISTFGGRTPAPTVDEDQLFIAGVVVRLGRPRPRPAPHLRVQQGHRRAELVQQHRRHPRRRAAEHAGHRGHQAASGS